MLSYYSYSCDSNSGRLGKASTGVYTIICVLGNLLSETANGLHGAGLFKSFLPHAQLNSSLDMAGDWEIREL